MCKVRVRVRVQSGSASKLRPRRRRRRARSRTLVLGRSGSCRASLPLGPATPSTGLFLAVRARTTVVRICLIASSVLTRARSCILHYATSGLQLLRARPEPALGRGGHTRPGRCTTQNVPCAVRRAACGDGQRTYSSLKNGSWNRRHWDGPDSRAHRCRRGRLARPR